MSLNEAELFTKVLVLLSFMIAGATTTALLFRCILKWSASITIWSLALAIVMLSVVKLIDPAMLIMIMVAAVGGIIGWVLMIFILFVTLNKKQEIENVGLILVFITIIMMSATITGSISGFNYEKPEELFCLILWSILTVLIIGMFVISNKAVEMTIGLMTFVSLLVYTLYSFNEVVGLYRGGSWEAAMRIVMYLFRIG